MGATKTPCSALRAPSSKPRTPSRSPIKMLKSVASRHQFLTKSPQGPPLPFSVLRRPSFPQAVQGPVAHPQERPRVPPLAQGGVGGCWHQARRRPSRPLTRWTVPCGLGGVCCHLAV